MDKEVGLKLQVFFKKKSIYLNQEPINMLASLTKIKKADLENFGKKRTIMKEILWMEEKMVCVLSSLTHLGQGKQLYDNGDQFEGQWEKGKRVSGLYCFKNGEVGLIIF